MEEDIVNMFGIDTVNGWIPYCELSKQLKCSPCEIINIYNSFPYLFTEGVDTKEVMFKGVKKRAFMGKGTVVMTFKVFNDHANGLFKAFVEGALQNGGDPIGYICWHMGDFIHN